VPAFDTREIRPSRLGLQFHNNAVDMSSSAFIGWHTEGDNGLL
jgi:hypothetical protein